MPRTIGAPPVSEEETERLLQGLPGWEIVTTRGFRQLKKTFKFQNFQEALDFTNLVGAAAEAEAHHPSINTQWGSVTTIWWTHKIKDLHISDFIMASKTEEAFNHKGEAS